MKRIWLSVDWDFFQEEKVEWDWGHRETSMFAELVWPTRMLSGGTDLRPITDPDAHLPSALGFWNRMKWNFTASEIAVTDSHAVALPFFHAIGKHEGAPDEVWNFDAHHDLGYHSLKTLRQWAKEGRAEAGSWLYVLLRTYPELRCKFIHPIWKDPTIEARPWLKERGVAKRVTVTKTSAFDWNEQVEVTGIFIAKSESWSPPWNDQKFTRFVEEAEQATGLPYAPYGHRDAITERAWDAAGAEKIGRFFCAPVPSSQVLRSEHYSKEEL